MIPNLFEQDDSFTRNLVLGEYGIGTDDAEDEIIRLLCNRSKGLGSVGVGIL